MVAIHLRGVSKRFGSTQVLQQIEAKIPDGAFAVLVGPSGCGKSTLLRLIAGLEETTSGSVWFGDEDVTDRPPRERDIAMVFQSYALYPHMNVRDNLAFGLKLRKTAAATIDSRVAEVAATLDIEHLLERYPRQLSGGQRQRVAMGRAIVRRPALFMFDEPLSNLDPALRTQVRVDIRRLHDELGATSVYVTHDQVEAMTLADILFVLDKGIVQQEGHPLEIYRRPANCFVAGFLGAPAMNLIPATVVDSATVRLSDNAIELPDPDAFLGLEAGREIVIGIRPQDLRLVAEDRPAHLEFDLEFAETLGPHVNLHGKVAGTPVIATIDGTHGPDKGARLRFVAVELHLFDAATEATLRSPEDA